SKSSFRNSVYYVLKADYPKLEINKNKVRDVIDLMVNKLSSGVIIVDNDYYLGVITLRDILKTYADQGIKALDLELNALPIIEGVYSDIGSTISELASLMYIKGSDVAAIFCGNSLCGGVDDLALFNYLYSNLNKE
ncbi:MAG: CBS domain-containing protein, partial [Caldisphaera sp.]|nr:CBS domain-containing protein [Caldisphaera sp.]